MMHRDGEKGKFRRMDKTTLLISPNGFIDFRKDK